MQVQRTYLPSTFIVDEYLTQPVTVTKLLSSVDSFAYLLLLISSVASKLRYWIQRMWIQPKVLITCWETINTNADIIFCWYTGKLLLV